MASSRAVVALLFACGCQRAATVEARRDPAQSALSATASASSSASVMQAPAHRVKGDIDGQFTVARPKLVVGEPIVVAFELRPRGGPLTVALGGDMRNTFNYPLRFAVRAVDESGKTVCDVVDKPPFMSFGGPGSEQVIAKGDTYRERFVLNPACPALATPGRYRVTVHRRLTTMAMTIKRPSSPTPLSCDVTPIHEDPLPPGIEPGCVPLLHGAPSITSDFDIAIAPFDQAAVRAEIRARLSEAPKDEILRHRLERFVCGSLTCSCPRAPVAEADMLAAIGPSPQPKFPAACP